MTGKVGRPLGSKSISVENGVVTEFVKTAIVEFLKSNDKSGAALSERAGISRLTLYDFMNGKTSLTLRSADKLLKAIDEIEEQNA